MTIKTKSNMKVLEKAIENIEEVGYLKIDTSKIDFVKEINKLKKEKTPLFWHIIIKLMKYRK